MDRDKSPTRNNSRFELEKKVNEDLNAWKTNLAKIDKKELGKFVLYFWSDGPSCPEKNVRYSYGSPPESKKPWDIREALSVDQNMGPKLIATANDPGELAPPLALAVRLDYLGFCYVIHRKDVPVVNEFRDRDDSPRRYMIRGRTEFSRVRQRKLEDYLVDERIQDIHEEECLPALTHAMNRIQVEIRKKKKELEILEDELAIFKTFL